MPIGYLSGRQRDINFQNRTERSHTLIRKLYEQFEERYGSILCRDVRERVEADCPQVVGPAAKWAAQILVDEFAANRYGKEDPAPALENTDSNEGHVDP
jgi:hypothetical protein